MMEGINNKDIDTSNELEEKKMKKKKVKKKKREKSNHTHNHSDAITEPEPKSISTGDVGESSVVTTSNSKKRKLSEEASEKPSKKKKSLGKEQSSTDLQSPEDEETNREVLYPYEVQPDDHCETPTEAYEDIACVLHHIAKKVNKSPSDLFIYDPFYCEGSMMERMASLGFSNVYNRKEDFYAVQAAHAVPDYDVLMTNPPYSQDHMERLLRFCVQTRKPFLLLIPNYVYCKDYYSRVIGSTPMFYVTPSQGRRYMYTTPKVHQVNAFLLRSSLD